MTDDYRDEIAELIFAGRKIEAIKRYREITGEGLREAKAYVETLTNQLQAESPERFTAKSASGCAYVFLLFAVLTGLSYWFILAT